MENILEQIVASVRKHEEEKWNAWEAMGMPPPPMTREPTPILPMLAQTFVLIAECKHASPSRGVIRAPYAPSAIAKAYARGGAHAISVLSEEHFFKGSLEHLTAVKRSVSLPVLCKDFIVHPFQIQEAYAAGADMILLIKKLLTPANLVSLLRHAIKFHLTPLIEIFNIEEGQQVLTSIHHLGFEQKVILGINNRNLQTFEVDIQHTHKVIQTLRTAIPIIGESGIRTARDLSQLRTLGCAGALVGETLLKQEDCTQAVVELLSELLKQNF